MDKTFSDLMDIVNRSKKYDSGKPTPKPRPKKIEPEEVEEEYTPREYDIEVEKPKRKTTKSSSSTLSNSKLSALLEKTTKTASKNSTSTKTTSKSSTTKSSTAKKTTEKKTPAKTTTAKTTTKKSTTGTANKLSALMNKVSTPKKKTVTEYKPIESKEPEIVKDETPAVKEKSVTKEAPKFELPPSRPKIKPDKSFTEKTPENDKDAQLYAALKNSLFKGGTDISEYLTANEEIEMSQQNYQDNKIKHEASKINEEISKEQQEYEQLFTGSFSSFYDTAENEEENSETFARDEKNPHDSTYELATGNKDLDKKIADYYKRKQQMIDKYNAEEEYYIETPKKQDDVVDYSAIFSGEILSRDEVLGIKSTETDSEETNTETEETIQEQPTDTTEEIVDNIDTQAVESIETETPASEDLSSDTQTSETTENIENNNIEENTSTEETTIEQVEETPLVSQSESEAKEEHLKSILNNILYSNTETESNEQDNNVTDNNTTEEVDEKEETPYANFTGSIAENTTTTETINGDNFVMTPAETPVGEIMEYSNQVPVDMTGMTKVENIVEPETKEETPVEEKKPSLSNFVSSSRLQPVEDDDDEELIIRLDNNEYATSNETTETEDNYSETTEENVIPQTTTNIQFEEELPAVENSENTNTISQINFDEPTEETNPSEFVEPVEDTTQETIETTEELNNSPYPPMFDVSNTSLDDDNSIVVDSENTISSLEMEENSPAPILSDMEETADTQLVFEDDETIEDIADEEVINPTSLEENSIEDSIVPENNEITTDNTIVENTEVTPSEEVVEETTIENIAEEIPAETMQTEEFAINTETTPTENITSEEVVESVQYENTENAETVATENVEELANESIEPVFTENIISEETTETTETPIAETNEIPVIDETTETVVAKETTENLANEEPTSQEFVTEPNSSEVESVVETEVANTSENEEDINTEDYVLDNSMFTPEPITPENDEDKNLLETYLSEDEQYDYIVTSERLFEQQEQSKANNYVSEIVDEDEEDNTIVMSSLPENRFNLFEATSQSTEPIEENIEEFSVDSNEETNIDSDQTVQPVVEEHVEQSDTISKEEFYNEMARLQENLINELKGNNVEISNYDYFAEKPAPVVDNIQPVENTTTTEDIQANTVVDDMISIADNETTSTTVVEQVLNQPTDNTPSIETPPTEVQIQTQVIENIQPETQSTEPTITEVQSTTTIAEEPTTEEKVTPVTDETVGSNAEPVAIEDFEKYNLLNKEVALNEEDLKVEETPVITKTPEENYFYGSNEDKEKKAQVIDEYMTLFNEESHISKEVGDINIFKNIGNAVPSSQILKEEKIEEQPKNIEKDEDGDLETIYTLMGIQRKTKTEDKKEIKVLYCASECQPFVASGGLADVAGSLPKAIAEKGGVDIRVIMPLYGNIKAEYRDKFEYLGNFTVHLAWRQEYCGLFRYFKDGVTYYFIDNERYFKRDTLYGYYDDGERFAYFSKAIVEALPHLNFFPDIIHCNDWQTALVSTYVKTGNWSDHRYYKIRYVYTIHNVEYQGVYGMENIKDLFGIDPRFKNDVEYNGDINLTKAAIQYCDKLTTVSNSYCDNLKQPYCSRGLHHIIIRNEYKLSGIINGIDYEFYNPATDKILFKNYDIGCIEEKVLNKKLWQEEIGLPVDGNTPMLAIVSRLVGHKGLDLVSKIVHNILQQDIQLVVVGTGDQKYVDLFKSLEQKYPTKVRAFVDKYSNEIARKAYGASDLFVMPSKIEPCGLSQMISSRYGSVPIVREVGGLKDTIRDFGCEGGGNGYTFANYNASDLEYQINRAIKDYSNKSEWREKMHTCMNQDYTWKKPALSYIDLYKSITSN